MSLNQIHGAAVLLLAPLVGNLVLAVWAGLNWRHGRRTLPPAFWGVLLLLLAILTAQAAAGILMFLGGARPLTGLHLLYGVLVLAVGTVQYGLRPGTQLRRTFVRAPEDLNEPRVLAVLCFFQFGLLARAWTTAIFGR